MKKCPKCGNPVDYDCGGQTGKYICRKCGYLGVLVLEEDDKRIS